MSWFSIHEWNQMNVRLNLNALLFLFLFFIFPKTFPFPFPFFVLFISSVYFRSFKVHCST